MEVRMPSFLEKMKSGAERATFEADRLRRLTQAKSALKALEEDLEKQTIAIGQQVLALYDEGCLTQPELLTSCSAIDTLRQKINAQETEVERVQQENPATEPIVEQEWSSETPPLAPAGPQKAAVESMPGSICVKCHGPLAADARFCPECGTPVAQVQAA
jgi:hypothetical protein